MSSEDENWKLSELPPNLAAMSCTHILEGNAAPTFVDYNGGNLTIFCDKGEDHTDVEEYRMACLSDFLSTHQTLHDLYLIGGYSRAERDVSGNWQTSLQAPWDEEN